MARKLVQGARLLGHLLDEGGQPAAVALVELDSDGAIITVPDFDPGLGAFQRVLSGEVAAPDVAFFVAGTDLLVLADSVVVGTSVSSSGAFTTRTRSFRTIRSHSGLSDFSSLHALRSRVDGLATWSQMSAVSVELNFSDEQGLKDVVVRGSPQPEVQLGGRLGATIVPNYSYTPPGPNGAHALSNVLTLETRSGSSRPWQEHAREHVMIQDLMSLVFGRPCLLELEYALDAGDQPLLDDESGSPVWSEVYEPSYGRSSSGLAALSDKRQPLFRLADVDPEKLAQWLDEADTWSRPTAIVVTTMFLKNSTVETQLLQMGVGLEALGYALWLEAGNRAAGTGTPNFLPLLRQVHKPAADARPALPGGLSDPGWPARFNAAFKGAKHADNQAVAATLARQMYREGLALVRFWLGNRLGVSDETMVNGLGLGG